MTTLLGNDLSRRAFVRLGLVLPASVALLTGAASALRVLGYVNGAAGQELELTPACDDNPQATPPETEGPFFTRNSPERRSLVEPDMGGTHLVLAGYALSPACQPVAGALLDFWQADERGLYDNTGYRLRGHQFTDDTGRYELETLVPGLYPGRTRHIHVKVQPPGGRVLTTQLYFPDEPRNRTDSLFRPALLMGVNDGRAGKAASFNFVVNTAA